MKRKKKIGIAATSLAAAMTLLAPGVASANEVCTPETCNTGGDPFLKVTLAREQVEEVTEHDFIKYEPFVKFEWAFLKIKG